MFKELLHSRTRKWGFACMAMALLLTTAWGGSGYWHLIIDWTNNGDFNQLGTYRGGVYWIRTEEWWCDVPLDWDVDSARYGYDFGQWPGFENTSRREFWGFQFTEGIWHPPLLDMNRFQGVARLPKSAPFHSWFVPYWPCVLTTTLLAVLLIAMPAKSISEKPKPTDKTGSDVERSR